MDRGSAGPLQMVEWRGLMRTYSAHPKAVAARAWRKDNPEKQREACANQVREYHRLRRQIIDAYGGRCQCPGGCESTEYEFMAVDHVDGGGAQHRKRRASHLILRDIKRAGFPPEYRVLCHNCNMARGLYGACPHEENGVEIAAVVAA